LPDRSQAFTGLPTAFGVYGSGVNGRHYNDHLFQGGGQGGSLHGDGKSALLYPTSAANTSVELFETRVPLLVERKELIADSGGAGRSRGGLGQRVEIRKLTNDGRSALISWQPQGVLVDVPGLHGGLPGCRAGVRFDEESGTTEGRALGGLVILERPTQRLTIELAGGSGFGDPRDRETHLVQADLDEGLVTHAALPVYGCTVDADGRVVRANQAL